MSGPEPTEASATDVGAVEERDAEPKGPEAGSRIDRVARALFAYACLPGQPGRWYSGVRKIYEASAKAAIAAYDAALSEAGLVIVPIEPTEKMRDAGIGTGKCDSSDLQPAEPETVWRAMAAAAQEEN